MINLKYKGSNISIPTKIFIDNEWHDSIDCNDNFNIINPVNEECLGIIGLAGKADVDKAVESSRKAFNGEWSSMSPMDRGRLIYKLSDLIETKYREPLAAIESINVGKPISESLPYDMKQVINTLRYFAGWSDKITGKTIPVATHPSDTSKQQVLAYTKQVPIGVCALILPWNFPLQLLCFKLAPSLAAGNTVIIKPSEFTPLSTFYLATIIKEAGFPPGVVNVLCGTGNIVGDALASHQLIDKIGFTGSTKVGKMVQNAATNSNMKHVSLELGGKSPIIIFEDCENLDLAVANSYHALFWNAGQCCSAASRIYVQSSIYSLFLEKMKQMVIGRILGDPLEMSTHQGPQVNRSQFESVMKYIEIGKNEGANLICGGQRWKDKGYFIEPTVFADVSDSMVIAKEEIFGPVMCVLKFDTFQEVIDRANNSEYGLVGSIFTKDINKAIIASDRLRSGLVWVNSYNIIDPAIPWGGLKLSGKGRDISEYSLQMWTETKTVVINASL